jgi:hypothetical protein
MTRNPGVTLAGDVALFLRRPGRQGGILHLATGVPRRHAAVFAAAVLIAACGVGLARTGAAHQPQAGFTQLCLSPQYQNQHTLSLGVSNDQGSTTGYRLVLLRNGQVSASWNLTLANGPDLAAVGAVHRHVHPRRQPVPATRPYSPLPVCLHRQ